MAADPTELTHELRPHADERRALENRLGGVEAESDVSAADDALVEQLGELHPAEDVRDGRQHHRRRGQPERQDRRIAVAPFGSRGQRPLGSLEPDESADTEQRAEQ